MTNKKIILGYGLLGKELAEQTGWDYISRSKDDFDFCNLNTYITKIYKYNTIINCIAYTNTYSNNYQKHLNTNYIGVIDLANYCSYNGKKLVHISTDYIYAGNLPQAKETDVPVHCRNWYTYTKLLADAYIQSASKNYLLIRTSFKPNPFPYTHAITTQRGNFDYVDVIARLIIRLIVGNANGIYNVGTEEKTIYELALKTNPAVAPSNTMLDVSMPTDVTMDLSKMKEFLNEH